LPARLCFKIRAAILCSKLLWISWRLCSSSRKISFYIWPQLCSLEEVYPLAPLQNEPCTRLNGSEENSPKYAFCLISQVPLFYGGMRWELNCGFHIEVGRAYILISYFMLCSENSLLNLSLSVMRRSTCIKPNLAISAANGRIKRGFRRNLRRLAVDYIVRPTSEHAKRES
jgi:hypothetical protein